MSKTTFYQKNYIGFPPVKIAEFENPDSYHWQQRTLDMKYWLIAKMGKTEFAAWADRLFPGDSIDDATWKEIFDLYEAKFRVIQGEEREAIECSCKPDLPDGRCFPLCPACKADIDRAKDKDEIPF